MKLCSKPAEFLYNRRSKWAIPTQLGVALTSRCNIRCRYCMRETFRPLKGEITLEKMKKILRRAPSINGVCIMGLCEPYCNREASDILRWLKDEGGYSISFTTNCTYPFTENMMDALRRVDDMAVSIDSPDLETFRRLRGTSLVTVLSNLYDLIHFKRVLGLKAEDNPPIHINAVITKQNWSQIPDLIRLFEMISDDITYLMLDPCTRPDNSKEDNFALTHKPDNFEEYKLIAKTAKIKVIGFDWMFKASTEWSSCHISWYGPFIHANGDMYPCYKYDYTLGNVFNDNPIRLWNSDKMKRFRRRLRTGSPPLQQCRTCNFARPKWQPGGAYYTRKEDQE